MIVELVIAGFIVGILVGLTSVGGGSLLTPLLVIVFGMDPLVAVGTDLLYGAPTKIYGAYLHYKQGTVNGKLVRALCLGGLPAAAIGVAMLIYFHQHIAPAVFTLWIKRAIGISLLFAGVLTVARPLLAAYIDKHAVAWGSQGRGRATTIGAVVGWIVSVTSIGSGSATLPLLSFALPGIALRELIGSDIAFSAFLVPTAAAAQWSLHNVNLTVALALLLGSLPGVYLGSRLCRYLHEGWLRPVVAVILLAVGVRLV